jgi:acetyltransferase-like isoleucine patch superfamily enzyme
MILPTVRIHASADVSTNVSIGQGTSVWNNAQIREDASIGEECIIGTGVYIDFGVQIGDHVKIQNGAFVYHGVAIESGVFIGPGVIFTNDKKPRAINPDGSLKSNDDWEVGPIRVCYGASVGAGSVILPNVTIGQFALVGAGSVVTRDVAQQALVVGNPARQIGYVCKCAARLTPIQENLYQCPDCKQQYSFISNSLFAEAIR